MTDFFVKYCEDIFRFDYHASLTNWKAQQKYQKNMCSFAINKIARKKILWSNKKYNQQNIEKEWSCFITWHAECDLVFDNHENEVSMKWLISYLRNNFW